MGEPIRIDGGEGEGGGQLLRSALALSVLTGRAFEMIRIRAGRPTPGLAPQHLRVVRLFRAIAAAECRGDRERSQELSFSPGPPRPGRYEVDVGTAGSVTLIVQAVAPVLGLLDGASTLRLVGGTHVPWSPPYEYLEQCWLPQLRSLGLGAALRLERAGFYPRGGGVLVARFEGGGAFAPLRLVERGPLERIEITSAAARLPGHVVQRQASRARTALGDLGVEPTVRLERLDALSPGSVVAATAVFAHARMTATALGARGKRAEQVGEEAARSLRAWIEREGAVDPHLADQLLLPLALAEGASEYTTVRVTGHLLGQARLVGRFVDRPIAVEGALGEPGRVRVGRGPGPLAFRQARL